MDPLCRARRSQGAFSLIELMVVVSLVSVLAAVAIPSYIQYVRKTKTVEAVEFLNKIYIGARAYLMDDVAARGEGSLPPQFPVSEPLTPAASCCLTGGKCPPASADWRTPTWLELKFSIDDPHYYRYEFVSSGTGSESAFSARARGNLDCDDVESTFEMTGFFDGQDVRGQAEIYRNNPTE